MMKLDIRVNQDHIAHISANRRDNFISVDELSIYDWEANFYPCPESPVKARDKMRDPGPPRTMSGIVRHRYKDGATTLAFKILQELERQRQ